jgi:beta-lactamase class A
MTLLPAMLPRPITEAYTRGGGSIPGVRPLAFLLLAVCSSAVAAARQPAASSSSLERALRSEISSSGAEVSLALATLDGRYRVLIDPVRQFHAASTMKLPVMIELFRQAHAGLLSLDEALPIRNSFHSIVDGSEYKLSAGDDSDRAVYAAEGKTMTLRELCEAMITVSSNYAANLLIERLGVENIRKTVSRLGAGGMHVLRGVEDQKAFDKGLNNTTSARALLVLLEALARGSAVGPEADGEMIAILKRQTLNDAIPAGLPPGVAVAHKTGTITRIHHDAGIVYAARPYVLVVLVRGIDDEKKSAGLIAALSRIVYDGTQ